MNNLKKIYVVLFLLSLQFVISCGESVPGTQFAFINPSNKDIKILLKKEGENENAVEKTVKAHSTAYDNKPAGVYQITSFDETGKSIVSIEKFDTAKFTKDYLCIDLEGKSKFAFVNAKFIYESTNDFAKDLADKTKGTKLVIGAAKENTPFTAIIGTIMPYTEMPKKTNAMSSIIALVPLPTNLKTEDELNQYIFDYLKSLPQK
jgi:hypothetical protein